jgi:hypothetical protein
MISWVARCGMTVDDPTTTSFRGSGSMIDLKTTTFASLVVMMAPLPALASCWNAADTGVPGPSAEICISGVCETTTLDFECANATGMMAGYTNGLHIEVDVSVTPERVIVSRDGNRLSDQEVADATCAADDREACKFGTYIETNPDAVNNRVDIAAIKQRFDGLLGVDAVGFQQILIETGFLKGIPDGVWGPSTEAAVSAFMVAADEYGISIDASSDEKMFQTMYAASSFLYDPRSGLARYPFDGAHLLVIASRSTYEEAEPVYNDVEATMTSIGFAGRAGVYPAISGVLAITVGMYPKDICSQMAEEFKGQGLIPLDSYCLPVDKIDPMAWTN